LDEQEQFRMFVVFKKGIAKEYIFDSSIKTQVTHATE
jgi:hypothetical protein